jgi:hypothetical protein
VTPKVPPFSEPIAAASVSAVHLEMRDQYAPDDPEFLNWLATGQVADPSVSNWYELVRTHVARGIAFRRARVITPEAY